MCAKVTSVKVGEHYEQQALQFLVKKKLSLVAKNYRCKWGEIDLLMLDKGVLVVVEVRYRKNSRYGSALESVTTGKQAKIIAATKHYIVAKKIDQPIRFDVIAITGSAEIEWVKNAF